ncbi:MAG: endonuclease [Prolixibacteraceae bacterium]|nr:endonuclease [Prolixibacteraceae bacterium]
MRSIFALILLFLLPSYIFPQNQAEETRYRILFYNVENLFDTEDHPFTNDDEFTPNGDRHWTNKKLEQKIDRLAKVVVAASGAWESPGIIGLCEIENLFVLEKLVGHPLLKKAQYRIIHKDSPDHRGIDVAFLYRKNVFFPENYSAIPITSERGDTIATREILHVSGKFQNEKVFHFLVNHWPSRYGGLMETDADRKRAAGHLKNAIRNIMKNDPDANIICMGDFNDQPQDESLSKVLNAFSPKDSENAELINLSAEWDNLPTGTLKHQHEWAVFDQFIVSKNLLKDCAAGIFSPDFLLEKDPKYAGYRPFRTFNGFRYNGGFSDHLPIIIEIKVQ